MNPVTPDNGAANNKRPYKGASDDLPRKKRLRSSTQVQARDNESASEEAPASSSSPSTSATSPETPNSSPTDKSASCLSPESPTSQVCGVVSNDVPNEAHDGQVPAIGPIEEECPANTKDNDAVSPKEEDQAIAQQNHEEGPKIWAKRRQGLCDALPYFKAHQGSLYTVNNVPLGFFIAKEARSRDHFDGQVIITTVGGGRVPDKESGQMIRVRDQEEKGPLKAMRRCKKEQIPLAMIAGNEHPFYPIEPPHPYCVLDYFHVTDVWSEKQVYLDQEPRRVWCVRLEKINLHTKSWWHPAMPSLSADEVQQCPHATIETCKLCNQGSKTIYAQGWTCLNHKCDRFMEVEGKEMDFNALEYAPKFIAERTQYTGIVPDLVPPLPSEELLKKSHGSEKILRVGIVCPDCGCCSSRRSWDAWECENCPFRLPGQVSGYPPGLLVKERKAFEESVKRMQAKNGEEDPIAIRLDSAHIISRTLDLGGKYLTTQYLLPGEDDDKIGTVTVFHADQSVCSRENGPDEIFEELCTQDIGLRRNPVTRVGSKTEIWTRHFAQNWGAPYKFAVTVQSKAFDEAPPSIMKAVHRMLWAGKTAAKTAGDWIQERGEENPVPQGDVVFNELLSLGYMEDDRIAYHDDGEKELGHTVATLSLGCPAIMSFRPKKKSTIPVSCPPKSAGADYPEVLSLPLFHGDLVVMHGQGIHKLYDHKVDPQGARRFALTCRYIDPATMKSKEDQEAAITKGKIPSDSFEKYAYNGE